MGRLELQHSPEVTGTAAERSTRANDSSGEVARLRAELERVRTRASKLLELNTALSEARSVDDVTRVVLSKGLAVVEAARGILISLQAGKLTILGSSGFSPAI